MFYLTGSLTDGTSALWYSDGGPGGPRLLREPVPLGWEQGAPSSPVAVDESIAFTMNDGAHGVELWMSDGTAFGTRMVADIVPGPRGSKPRELRAVNGQVFCSATTLEHSSELWASDGTAAGTAIVADLAPGPEPTSPHDLAVAGPRLFFSANDGVAGEALWALPLTTQPYRRAQLGARLLVEAERYDRGGEGLAYADRDPANRGGALRLDEGVDIQAAQGGRGAILAFAQAGEWVNYTVHVMATRAYTLELSLASPGAGGTFHLELDGADLTGPVAVPNTGGWSSWQTVRVPGVPLVAGRRTLRLVFDAAGPSGYVGNLDYFALDGADHRQYAPVVRQR